MKHYLAIETSCDDTSVALVTDQGQVLLCRSQSQDSSHAVFGGIVPEIASRNHTHFLLPLIEKVLQQTGFKGPELAGLVVTARPGLIGSLIVGVVTAKSLALAWKIPWIGVNHLEGHLLAPFLKDDTYHPAFDLSQAYLALTVSGGHSTLYDVSPAAAGPATYKVLGSTLDDAAGEAFDKFGKMLGLGFPGGVAVDQFAQSGDPKKYAFPRGLIHEKNLDYSFSGLKSAAHRLLTKMTPEEIEMERPHLCASFQQAVVDALLAKLDRAQMKTRRQRIVLTGGVSANSWLRSQTAAWAQSRGCQLAIPPLRYCTDNAAMIGYAGAIRMRHGEFSDMKLGPSPASLEGDFQ